MARKEKTALETASNILLRRFHTEMELRRKLYAKELFTKSDIEKAIAELRRYNFLDDERFAEDFTNAMRSRSWGNLRIANRLRLKGVSKEIIDKVLSTATTEDQLELALKALEKQHRALERVTDFMKRKAKALRHLASKGFSGGIAYEAINIFFKKDSK